MKVFSSVILTIVVVAFLVWNICGMVKDIRNAKQKKCKKDNKQENINK